MSAERNRSQSSNLRVVSPISSSFEDFEEGAHKAALEAEGNTSPNPNEITCLQELVKKLHRES
ncbi:hypothetical protein AMTR_s00081p00086890 [Amborella trichopoda]|uniref:Uncharacterized protein n=1 Tax=Amborella trichopoda TaxID=13333 RepID=W1P9X1_AMBTC|nr:hypothetical protein AMTR_s00081p00086890 [Amborella trichopoda]